MAKYPGGVFKKGLFQGEKIGYLVAFFPFLVQFGWIFGCDPLDPLPIGPIPKKLIWDTLDDKCECFDFYVLRQDHPKRSCVLLFPVYVYWSHLNIEAQGSSWNPRESDSDSMAFV